MSSESSEPVARRLLDRVTGKSKQVVGNLLGNENLAEEGQVQVQKVEAADEAARLSVEAEQTEEAAELTAEQEANRVEQQRVQADLAEIERQEQLDRDRRDAEIEVERQAAARVAAIAQQEKLETAIIEQEKVNAAEEHIEGVVEAAEIEKEAKTAQSVADSLDAAQSNLEQRGR